MSGSGRIQESRRVAKIARRRDVVPVEHARLTVSEYVELLRRLDVDATGTPVDWANEAHRAAIEFVYALPDDLNLDEAYDNRNRPVVDRQLARAQVSLSF